MPAVAVITRHLRVGPALHKPQLFLRERVQLCQLVQSPHSLLEWTMPQPASYIYKKRRDGCKHSFDAFQAAAGMGVFGPRTVYCIALKDAPGCHEFLLQDDGKWVHVKETTEIGQYACSAPLLWHECNSAHAQAVTCTTHPSMGVTSHKTVQFWGYPFSCCPLM